MTADLPEDDRELFLALYLDHSMRGCSDGGRWILWIAGWRQLGLAIAFDQPAWDC